MQYRVQRWMSPGCGSRVIHHLTEDGRPNRSKDLYAKVLIYGRGPLRVTPWPPLGSGFDRREGSWEEKSTPTLERERSLGI